VVMQRRDERLFCLVLGVIFLLACPSLGVFLLVPTDVRHPGSGGFASFLGKRPSCYLRRRHPPTTGSNILFKHSGSWLDRLDWSNTSRRIALQSDLLKSLGYAGDGLGGAPSATAVKVVCDWGDLGWPIGCSASTDSRAALFRLARHIIA
jgi:hypothetical protein